MLDARQSPKLFLAALPTIGAIALLELLAGFGIFFPYPGAVLLGTVSFAAFKAGAGAGWVSTSVTVVYGVLAFAEPGQMFVYNATNLTRVISLAVSTPVVMLAICALRRHELAAAYRMAQSEARVEVKHRVEEEHFQLTTILEQLPFGVVIVDDASCKISFANMEAMDLLGHDVTEFHPYAYHRMFHASGQPYTPDEWPLLRAFLKGEIVEEKEFLYAGPGGHLRPMWARVAPIRDGQDKIVAAAMVFHDVGGSRRADIAQRELAAIIAAIDDAILSMSLEGVILNWNPAAERMFGYTTEEIRGKTFRSLVPEDRAAEVAQALEQVRRGERVTGFETLGRGKNGESKPVSVRLSPLPDAAGQIQAATVVVRDLAAAAIAS